MPVFYFKKMVKKLFKNFEYSKLPEAKKLSVLGPDISFLEKSVYLFIFFSVLMCGSCSIHQLTFVKYFGSDQLLFLVAHFAAILA